MRLANEQHRLSNRLFINQHLWTVFSVIHYILTILLYGCESWTLYRHNKLNQFHVRCLRLIARIWWQDKIPNTEVLQVCNMTGIEAILMSAQFRWVGHVTWMDDTHIIKIVFYIEVEHGTRSKGGQLKWYKDTLKSNITACDLKPGKL